MQKNYVFPILFDLTTTVTELFSKARKWPKDKLDMSTWDPKEQEALHLHYSFEGGHDKNKESYFEILGNIKRRQILVDEIFQPDKLILLDANKEIYNDVLATIRLLAKLMNNLYEKV